MGRTGTLVPQSTRFLTGARLEEAEMRTQARVLASLGTLQFAIGHRETMIGPAHEIQQIGICHFPLVLSNSLQEMP